MLPRPLRPLRPHLIPLLLLLAAALLLVGPPEIGPGATLPGHPQSDLADHLWGWYWFKQEILAGRLPWRTRISHDLAGGPGGVLWFVDPIGALISVPLQLALPAPVAFALTVLLRVWSGLIAAYALAFSYARARIAAVAAALTAGAGAYTLSLLHSGVLEYLGIAPLFLMWWALRPPPGPAGPRPPRPGLAALAWAWACLGAFYYGAFAGLLWLGAAIRRPALGIAVLLRAAPLLALILIPAAWTLAHPEAVISRQSAPGWDYRRLPATDLLTFLHPSYSFPDLARAGNLGIVHADRYSLIALLIAAAVTVARRRDPQIRRLALAFGLLALLAAGPVLCVAGWIPRVGPGEGWPIPLPAALLYLPGSPLRSLHHPYRLVILPLIPLSLLVARALSRRPALAALAAAAVLAEQLRFSPARWPVARTPADPPPIYAALADAPEGAAGAAGDPAPGVLDFPPENRLQNRLYTLWQTAHGRPIPYGVNLYLPETLRRNPAWAAWMSCLRDRGARAIPRDGGPPAPPPPGPPPAAAGIARGRADLAARYGWLVAHGDALAPAESACLADLLGPPDREIAGDRAWRIVAAPDKP